MKRFLFVLVMFNCELIWPVKKNNIKHIQVHEGTLRQSEMFKVLLKGKITKPKIIAWKKGQTLKETLIAHEITLNPGDVLSTNSKMARFKKLDPADKSRKHHAIIVWRDIKKL